MADINWRINTEPFKKEAEDYVRALIEEPVEPPKQNTEEKGQDIPMVEDYHRTLAEAMLDYNYLTSEFSRGLMMLDLITKFTPKVGAESLFLGTTEDGWVKIKGGLTPKQYGKLVGSKNWKTLESKYEDEKYLVYDDTQEKDPVTGLYPEFDLMFKPDENGVGCYLKPSWMKYEDDGRPELTVEFKSRKEYEGA